MGGKVGFESVHNEGSLFWAFLPCEVDTLSMVEEKKEENKRENKSLSITICTTYLMPHSTDKLYIVNCK